LEPSTTTLMDHRLRIGIVAPPWLPVPPNGYGGTEAVLDRLAIGLERAGHEVLLVGHPDSTCPVDFVATQRLPAGTGIGEAAFELRHAVQAYRLLQDRRVDVIHDHTLAGPLLDREVAPAPIVTTNHGTFDDEILPLYIEIARRVPVLAISRSQAAQAVGLTPLAVIHHGLDVTRSPVGAGAGGYLVFLGRMHPTKGVHIAIEVARRAGMPLRIAAKMREGRELEYFRQRVEPLLGGDVEYIGEVGADAKQRLLADAVALLNPIRWPEPFGMVMIEALACGTPVVAFRNGAAPEIVEPGVSGLLCDTVEEMIEAVGRVCMIDRASCRRHAEEHFSTERMVDDHVAVYRSLVRSHGRHLTSRRPLGATQVIGHRSSAATVDHRWHPRPVAP
jgi:glycosyltransferase involved in cell wall biosynthesis